MVVVGLRLIDRLDLKCDRLLLRDLRNANGNGVYAGDVRRRDVHLLSLWLKGQREMSWLSWECPASRRGCRGQREEGGDL